MIEDDSSVDPKSVAENGHFDDAIQYDFAKFLTTMSLLMLGGVLTVTQTADKAVAKPPVVAVVMAFISIAGISAITAAGKLAKVNVGKDYPGFTPRRYLVVAILFLSAGAGSFLFLWWKTL
jgi:hypothetical protein